MRFAPPRAPRPSPLAPRRPSSALLSHTRFRNSNVVIGTCVVRYIAHGSSRILRAWPYFRVATVLQNLEIMEKPWTLKLSGKPGKVVEIEYMSWNFEKIVSITGLTEHPTLPQIPRRGRVLSLFYTYLACLHRCVNHLCLEI